MRSVSFAVAVVLLALGAGIAAADYTIDASADVWVREVAPDTTYENDGVSVWATTPDPTTPGARHGAIEFDISGVTEAITSAYIELYDVTGIHPDAFQQSAALLSPAGITTLTWNNLSGKTQTALDSLGAYNLAGPSNGSWLASAWASTADVAALESIRTGSGTVTMLLTAVTGEHDWACSAYPDTAHAPRLVLNAIPEPSAIMLLITGLIGLVCYAWRKRK